MALQKMTVCEKGACTSTANLPYEFYAQQGANTPVIVNLVMPVGGKETGFYRYPKKDERILVDDDGNTTNPTYYLMGYLPSATEAGNNFLTNANAGTSIGAFDIEQAALKNEEGMVLRYEQTGKDTPSATDITDRYSEIGFYRRKTQWTTEDKTYWDVENTQETDNAYSKRLVNAGLQKDKDETSASHIKRVTTIHDNWIPRNSEEADDVYSKRLVNAGLQKDKDETSASHIKRVTAIHENWIPRNSKEADDAYSKRLVDAGLPKKDDSETSASHIKRVTAIHENWIPQRPESDDAYSKRLVDAGLQKDKDETSASHIKRVTLVYKNWIPRIGTSTFPRIDQINIQSTGDIRQSAKNFQELKAGRLAILADCIEGGKNKSDHGDFDRAGDDSTLYEGDLHIRAKKRIIIKAGESICLQVGRSTITIDDSGVTIYSRKMHGNIQNYYDSVITVGAVGGIVINGTVIDIKAIYGASLADNMGGEIKTNAGIVRATGKDIQIKAFNTVSYLAKYIGFSAIFLENLVSSISSMAGGDTESELGTAVNSYPRLIGKIGSPVLTIAAKKILMKKFFEKRKKNKADTANSLVDHAITTFHFMRMIQGIVFTLLDAGLPAVVSKEAGKTARDSVSLASMIVEYGLSLYLFVVIGKNCLSSPLHTSYLHLTATAESILMALKNKILTAYDSTQSEGPMVALEAEPPEEEDKEDGIELEDLSDEE
ncbi:MAG: hypothetical protein LBF74_02155 [Treponema sp.]|jgi:hypothetical protein|nr:hypothetical protein [Treponema sp.]